MNAEPHIETCAVGDGVVVRLLRWYEDEADSWRVAFQLPAENVWHSVLGQTRDPDAARSAAIDAALRHHANADRAEARRQSRRSKVHATEESTEAAAARLRELAATLAHAEHATFSQADVAASEGAAASLFDRALGLAFRARTRKRTR